MYYSKNTGGFYTEEIHGVRKLTIVNPDPNAITATIEVDNPDCKIPADAVEIADVEHAALLEAQSTGKSIQADANGKPVALAYVKTAADLANEKAEALKQIRTLRAEVLNALGGIAGRAQRSGDTATATACDAASAALLNITADKKVAAAKDGPSTTLAVLACYKAAAMALAAVSPSSINAFDALELTL